MRPESVRNTGRSCRRGFALPLALFALLTVLMLVTLVLDAAIQELRASRGGLAATRAAAAVESAMSELLDSSTDSLLLSSAPGTARMSVTASGAADTVSVAVQRLGGRMVRTMVTATARASGVRGAAGAVAYLSISTDSTAVAGLRLRRLPGAWWAPFP